MYFYNDTSLINTNNLITINNQCIDSVKQYKLKYKKHITEIKIKITKLIYLFKKMYFIIDTNTLLPLCNAIIVPNYMYYLII